MLLDDSAINRIYLLCATHYMCVYVNPEMRIPHELGPEIRTPYELGPEIRTPHELGPEIMNWDLKSGHRRNK